MEEKRKGIKDLTTFFYNVALHLREKKRKKELFQSNKRPTQITGEKMSHFLRSPSLESNPVKL